MISLTDLVKSFYGRTGQRGTVRAVDNISLVVPGGSLVTLLGPSGCGKTTTLRCIAGLERPDGGEISIGGQTVFSSRRSMNVPPHKRRIGMVFQSYAIWPHMTVYENVAYALEGSKLSSRESKEKVGKALALVGLSKLESQPAPHLSGGEQQRVAVARALVSEPDVLLFDEPLSNLDAKLRETMRRELRRLQKSLGITALYVTHDQTEALAISDLIAVMNNGKIVEIGEPSEVYNRPRSKFVAEFIGQTNILVGRPLNSSGPGEFASAETALGVIFYRVPDDGRVSVQEVLLCIRPEDLEISVARPEQEENAWRGKIIAMSFLGPYQDCELEAGETVMRAHIRREMSLKVGDEVCIKVDPSRCIPLVSD